MKKYLLLLPFLFVLSGCSLQNPTSQDVLTSYQDLVINVGNEALDEEYEDLGDFTTAMAIRADINVYEQELSDPMDIQLTLAQKTTQLAALPHADTELNLNVNVKNPDIGNATIAMAMNAKSNKKVHYMNITQMDISVPDMLPEDIILTDPLTNTWYEISEATVSELLTMLGTDPDDMDIETLELLFSGQSTPLDQKADMQNILSTVMLIETNGDIQTSGLDWMVPLKLSSENTKAVVESVLAMSNLDTTTLEFEYETFPEVEIELLVKKQNIFEKMLGLPFRPTGLKTTFINTQGQNLIIDMNDTENNFMVNIQDGTLPVVSFVYDYDTGVFTIMDLEEDMMVLDGTHANDTISMNLYDQIWNGEEFVSETVAKITIVEESDQKMTGTFTIFAVEDETEDDITGTMTIIMPNNKTMNFSIQVSQEEIFDAEVGFDVSVKSAIGQTIVFPAAEETSTLVQFMENLGQDPMLGSMLMGAMTPQSDTLDTSPADDIYRPLAPTPTPQIQTEPTTDEFQAWFDSLTEDQVQELFGASKAEIQSQIDAELQQ